MSGRLVPLAELKERDLAAWRRLADSAAEPNPFFDPDFVLPAAAALGERDEVSLALWEDGGEWVACLPIRHYSRWHRLPLRCVATWLHPYCLLGTPLVLPGREAEGLAALLAAAGGGGGAFAGFEWVSAEGPIGEAIAAAAGARAIGFERFSRATLERREDGEYLEGRLNGKHRRELRRQGRKLAEELGEEPRLSDRGGDEAALDAFIELEASGWKGRGGTALAAIPGHSEFLRETARRFRARDAFRLYSLEAGGRAVAGRCSYVAGGVDFCFKVGYDEAFARFSPGRELELQMVDRFHADPGLRLLDSCTAPDNDLYNRLWRDRRELVSTVVPADGPRGRLAAPVVRAAIALRERRRERAAE
ncbi:MAG TPA: GNAT family N-acetyltransferase [Solirubrobacterales bacterium]|nr:GNAT family N-acetyltransferase [Solirubrobacterales bacterium]